MPHPDTLTIHDLLKIKRQLDAAQHITQVSFYVFDAGSVWLYDTDEELVACYHPDSFCRLMGYETNAA